MFVSMPYVSRTHKYVWKGGVVVPNIPNTSNSLLLAWMEQHADLWGVAPTTLGLSTQVVANFKGLVGESRTAFDSANAIRLASKQATVAQNEAFRDMKREASDLVSTIKSFIEQSGNTKLWADAGLEPPAPRGETPPPNAPYQLSGTLDSEGNLIVKWKATQPQGVSNVIYSIRRAFNNTGTYALIDTVGGKKFIDTTVPTGTTSVSYTITAKHGTNMSEPSESLTLRFGRNLGGGFTLVRDEAA